MQSQTEIQAWLITAVARHTGQSTSRIDIHRDLGRLGLDSMALIGLLAELEQALKRELSPEFLLDHRTIADISQSLASG